MMYIRQMQILVQHKSALGSSYTQKDQNPPHYQGILVFFFSLPHFFLMHCTLFFNQEAFLFDSLSCFKKLFF